MTTVITAVAWLLPMLVSVMSPRTVAVFGKVPVVLGARGMERVITIKLSADEQAAFDRSAAAVRELVTAMANLAAGSASGS